MALTDTNTSRDRLSSVQKRGLKALLLAATDGKCAACGVKINTEANAGSPLRFAVSHVRPACTFAGERAGYVTGNLFAGCGRCNDRTADTDLTPAVPAFAIPTGVIAWTPADLYRAGKAVAANKITDEDAEWEARWTKINAAL